MSVYLDKIDSDGNRVIFQGKRFEISKTRGKSQWSFFHRLIKNSEKRIDELKKTGYYDGAYKCVKLAAGIKE